MEGKNTDVEGKLETNERGVWVVLRIRMPWGLPPLKITLPIRKKQDG